MSKAIETFVATWMDEFGRAIEMFSGVQPAIAQKQTEQIAERESYLWFRQSFSSSKGTFATWIGAPEASWTDLGSVDPDNAQGMYLEIVGQAQTGAATVASRAVENPITAEPGEVVFDASFLEEDFVIFKLDIDSGRLPALIYAVERSATRVLQDAPENEAPGESTAGMLDVPEPLLDLELPVAISLGHAELPIKAVVNMKPGTAIELSTEIGQDLELLVHGTVIARGEITMVKGNYGLKIKEIVGAEDRLSLLKKN